MFEANWISQEVPLFEGLVCSSGESYEVCQTQLLLSSSKHVVEEWLSVAILAEQELYGGQFRLVCGEALEHGSFGVIVLVSIQTGAPIWSFASAKTNPFDQIEIKGGYVLVLSTSGAVFRFRPELQDVTIFIP